MKLTTIMYLHETFDLAKKIKHDLLGVANRGQKTSQKPKIRFFGLISWTFHSYITNHVICDILPWSASVVQISKESNSIWGSYTQKTTHKQPKIHFSVLWKHLKIHNLPTTNAVLMKATTVIYLHETFYLAKNWGVNRRT